MSYKSSKIHVTTGFRNGPGTLSGTTEESGVLGSYLVRLFDQSAATQVSATFSSSGGSFAFNALSIEYPFFVVAFDSSDGTPKNAAIADRQYASV